ncbi:hypothetical protein EPA93_32590 [Ktedonosporobacter rubrisoli]|uniref:Uncharacterized protein n=1 Tax=Ktedonosporobacter rubrisoli TaxID=2509675 RepID=A0A4P6JXH5_KTERU|nr:hypothetical protein [Ktedonosporobacter rubrisoli]QBD80457.1 hypothetical protein EPA93_32590 [Ktedonosporobacter rubrisoli]
MTQDELDALEASVQTIGWERVTLSPSQAEVQALDQQVPPEWLQPLERDFSQEEVQALLQAPLEIPEGDIEENARQALNELGVDVQEIMQELDQAPTLEVPSDLDPDHDWGR